MKIAFFDTHRYDRASFEAANAQFGHALTFFEPRLTEQTAPLAVGFEGICSFVHDRLDDRTLQALYDGGTRLVALRSAGYNHVDLEAAARLGLEVVRVPEYSPYAVAEHAVALALSLNRKTHRAHARVREGNFSLEGLVGVDLHRKTVGIVGMGRIGAVAARIFTGFGCRVLAFDLQPKLELATQIGCSYVPLLQLYQEADVISFHLPLTPETHHMIDAEALGRMKHGVMLINTSRGALLDTRALIVALKRGRVGSVGLDVYEEEEGVFFEDLSNQVLQDDVLARLLTFPNVLITSHQGFLTEEALLNIAVTTLESARAFAAREPLRNQLRAEDVVPRSSRPDLAKAAHGFVD